MKLGAVVRLVAVVRAAGAAPQGPLNYPPSNATLGSLPTTTSSAGCGLDDSVSPTIDGRVVSQSPPSPPLLLPRMGVPSKNVTMAATTLAISVRVTQETNAPVVLDQETNTITTEIDGQIYTIVNFTCFAPTSTITVTETTGTTETTDILVACSSSSLSSSSSSSSSSSTFTWYWGIPPDHHRHNKRWQSTTTKYIAQRAQQTLTETIYVVFGTVPVSTSALHLASPPHMSANLAVLSSHGEIVVTAGEEVTAAWKPSDCAMTEAARAASMDTTVLAVPTDTETVWTTIYATVTVPPSSSSSRTTLVSGAPPMTSTSIVSSLDSQSYSSPTSSTSAPKWSLPPPLPRSSITSSTITMEIAPHGTTVLRHSSSFAPWTQSTPATSATAPPCKTPPSLRWSATTLVTSQATTAATASSSSHASCDDEFCSMEGTSYCLFWGGASTNGPVPGETIKTLGTCWVSGATASNTVDEGGVLTVTARLVPRRRIMFY